MSLARRFQSEFEPHIRDRGHEYYRAGYVHLQSRTDTSAEAVVTRHTPYRATVEWTDGDLLGHCTCPAFAEGGEYCKHIYATLLSLDREESGAESGSRTRAMARRRASWASRLQLDSLSQPAGESREWPASREICYLLSAPDTLESRMRVHLRYRDLKSSGGWSVLKDFKPYPSQMNELPDALDREAIAVIAGALPAGAWYFAGEERQMSDTHVLPDALAQLLMGRLAESGRLYFWAHHRREEPVLLKSALKETWRYSITLSPHGESMYVLNGELTSGERRIALQDVKALYEGGFFVAGGELRRYDAAGGWRLMQVQRREGPVEIPAEDVPGLVTRLAELAPAALDVLPPEFAFDRIDAKCMPLIRLTSYTRNVASPVLSADLLFDYDGHRVPWNDPGHGIYLPDRRLLIGRDEAKERHARQRLADLDFKRELSAGGSAIETWKLAPNRLTRAVRTLVPEGWLVEADGQAFRAARSVKVKVTSGIDWFEVHGEADYGDATASISDILEAIREKRNLVRLSDGGYGLLPEEWLARFTSLAATGELKGEHLRFRKQQAGLLDAMVATLPDVSWDDAFASVRNKLQRFDGISPAEQPEGFQGKLRDYQREGLAWLRFLRTFGFGGCLADDMGLGKTAQVLAYLETRRAEGAGPSLAVVPRSLVTNWMREAARFTPKLRVVDYSGPQRHVTSMDDVDLVISTYGTLRLDAKSLHEREFDTVILDEAQAIKNASTVAAKSARLLRGKQRIAMSGTPIENHLGELWSLFEFLNPGMLGSGRAFRDFTSQPVDGDGEGRRVLSMALRPFILRRTKAQVAKELPARTEQTLYCELEGQQLEYYRKLRDAMRASVFGMIEVDGLAKSRMHVLEALLRLRQAACHPGLVDANQKDGESAKLDLLLDQIEEVIDEGHKALVFSQFTSLLALVRERLDRKRIVYEYLDGQTRDRQARVDRFQQDASCPLFLISLKAGGLGLNLTAAEYVYLLDPWWNPAVEAQAIDRTHRIGQTRRVFAYRLVAKDTVEEKILELQDRKRKLADAIITEDNSTLRTLSKEDLELLFS